MKHGSLFSGIGGFDLAAEWMGWENVFHCESAEFPKKLLQKRFPKSTSYNDIRQTDFTIHRGSVDILTGGFPCQNLSVATNAAIGVDESKSGLWRELLRATKEIEPKYVVIENSSLLLKRGFEKILDEFSSIGYDAEWECVQGYQVGIPQRRKRVFVVFYPTSIGNRLQERKICTGWHQSKHPAWRSTDPRIYGVANGVPNRVDRHRALGNSLITYFPHQIFKAIEQYENLTE